MSGERPDGWMHECADRGRQVWLPWGSPCVFCWMRPPVESLRTEVLNRVNEIRTLAAQSHTAEEMDFREFLANRIATLAEEIFELVDEEVK